MRSPARSSPAPDRLPPLPADFFLRPSETVARDLLGKGLYVALDGIPKLVELVETEAYHQEDPASHCFGGRTERNRVMFERGGTCYVYTLHRQICMNVVTGPPGVGEAVLLRAARPLEGRDDMMRNRRAKNEKGFKGAVRRPRELLSGPGRLCHALGIRLEHDGLTFDRKDLKLVDLGSPAKDIVVTTRVGISKAAHEPLRFFLKSASEWVSKPG